MCNTVSKPAPGKENTRNGCWLTVTGSSQTSGSGVGGFSINGRAILKTVQLSRSRRVSTNPKNQEQQEGGPKNGRLLASDKKSPPATALKPWQISVPNSPNDLPVPVSGACGDYRNRWMRNSCANDRKPQRCGDLGGIFFRPEVQSTDAATNPTVPEWPFSQAATAFQGGLVGRKMGWLPHARFGSEGGSLISIILIRRG